MWVIYILVVKMEFISLLQIEEGCGGIEENESDGKWVLNGLKEDEE